MEYNNTMGVCRECSELKREYWQNVYGHLNLSDMYVKAKFTQGDRVEWMWVEIKKDRGGKTLTGILNNDPEVVTNVKCEDKVIIKRSNISQHICEGHNAVDGFVESKEYVLANSEHRHQPLQH